MNWSVTVAIALAAILSAACSTPQQARSRETPVREVIDARFDSFLKEMERTEHFAGAALVMRDGHVLHAKGYGPATAHRANDVETKFHVGSITKEFTAAAIMQLVEKGVLKLDDSINRYLPSQYRSANWDAVTVHHLLSHTSGITDYALTRDYYRVVKGFVSDDTAQAMVKEAMSKDLQFAPGSKFAYTNLGYTLLGFIIENQTHTSYAEYVKNNLFRPLGMTSSQMHVDGHVPAPDEAEGLRWSEERATHVADEVVSLPATAPDGGLITTLGDFAKWARIFREDEQRILSHDSLKRMSSPMIAIGAGGPLDSMGYGLYVGDRLIGHGGSVVGFTSQFIVDRETRSLIVVFSNNASTNAQRVATGLLTVLLTPRG